MWNFTCLLVNLLFDFEDKAITELAEVTCDICGSSESVELLALHGSAYHQCTTCGLVYAKWVAVDYGDINEKAFAAEIDDYAAKIKARNTRYRKKLKMFDRYRADGNFLEIGCNAGAVLVAARDNGWNAKGVDISGTASGYAREKNDLDVHTGTIETASYPDNFFDVIYSNATLEHIQHPLSTIKECRRVLKPGGVLYVCTVAWDCYTREILGEDWLLLHPTHHIHLYTPDNIRSLCGYSGMKVVKIWTTGARVKANAVGSAFKTSWYLNLMKGPLSMMTRFTKKGDSIYFLATK
ncbi:MAG: class I SAM-dependent methyltransferase [bacterium]